MMIIISSLSQLYIFIILYVIFININITTTISIINNTDYNINNTKIFLDSLSYYKNILHSIKFIKTIDKAYNIMNDNYNNLDYMEKIKFKLPTKYSSNYKLHDNIPIRWWRN